MGRWHPSCSRASVLLEPSDDVTCADRAGYVPRIVACGSLPAPPLVLVSDDTCGSPRTIVENPPRPRAAVEKFCALLWTRFRVALFQLKGNCSSITFHLGLQLCVAPSARIRSFMDRRWVDSNPARMALD